jgi:imidazolonepropionase-like amidohydrolase
VVLPGFWNTHVHFTDPRFGGEQSGALLIDEMLLRYGFTSVVDTGADPRVIFPLREAIRAGRVLGPRVIVAGGSFVYKDGTPAYLPPGLLPELSQALDAAPAVDAVVKLGADGIKIFSGSFQSPSHTIHLPPEIVSAITQAAHQKGVFVVSHPTDREGLLNAVENGVDVLAHTAPPAGVLEPELLERMRDAKGALTPTLKLWRYELRRAGVPEAGVEAYLRSGVQQVRDFHRAGGEILFGTDVGYMMDFDTREEFELMHEAGLGFHDILETLTSHPARRFTETQGTLEIGEPADLVIINGDPNRDIKALANVQLVIRAGRIIYSK